MRKVQEFFKFQNVENFVEIVRFMNYIFSSIALKIFNMNNSNKCAKDAF